MTVALALTWDGARVPNRSLPPKARAFLGQHPAPPPKKMATLLANDQINELRICWIPRLSGHPATLSLPFTTPNNRRKTFRPGRPLPLGDLFGVVYRR